MSSTPTTPTKRDSRAMLEQYLSTRKQVSGNGRLLFAIDATASRRATWTTALDLQSDMFRQAGEGLSVSLIYFKGENECKATGWVTSSEKLVKSMRKIEVETGYTQIARILRHALCQHVKSPIAAGLYVGDACEENLDELVRLASELGAQKLPIFMFLEGKQGDDKDVERAFRLIAAKSGGAFFWFGTDSPQAVVQFAETLNAVAKLAVGDASAVAAMITHNK